MTHGQLQEKDEHDDGAAELQGDTQGWNLSLTPQPPDQTTPPSDPGPLPPTKSMQAAAKGPRWSWGIARDGLQVPWAPHPCFHIAALLVSQTSKRTSKLQDNGPAISMKEHPLNKEPPPPQE